MVYGFYCWWISQGWMNKTNSQEIHLLTAQKKSIQWEISYLNAKCLVANKKKFIWCYEIERLNMRRRKIEENRDFGLVCHDGSLAQLQFTFFLSGKIC